MVTDVTELRNIQPIGGAFSHDAGWELPELAPVLMIVSVGLIVLGSAVGAVMLFAGQSGYGDGVGWALISSALRWVDPSTSTMLLLSAALIWWQYGYWTSTVDANVAEEVIDEHIARLRTIAQWNLGVFVVTIASALLLILSSILQNTYSGDVIQLWGISVETICMALGTLLLSVFGVVGLRRILVASRVDDAELHWESS
jgi:hypothetical protein